jgi:hypothetical protein
MQWADKELVEADNADALEGRIQQGMDVNAEDGDGWTLLHGASLICSVKCLRV